MSSQAAQDKVWISQVYTPRRIILMQFRARKTCVWIIAKLNGKVHGTQHHHHHRRH